MYKILNLRKDFRAIFLNRKKVLKNDIIEMPKKMLNK